MLNSEKIQQFQQVFSQAGSILIMLPSQPSLDQAAAALALFSVAEANGKDVTICAPELEGISKLDLQLGDRITSDLGKRDLSVSFPYNPEAVDKVSYNIDEANQKFYLLIKPQKGQKPLAADKVEFSYSGAEADLVFLVGVHTYESLEHLYYGYEQLYQTAQVAVLHSFEPEIGTVKFDASGLSSLSEAMTQLIADSGFVFTPEAATNLLSAIEAATDGLSSLTITADTFERLAILLRAGAFRKRRLAKRQTLTNHENPVKLLPREVPFDAPPKNGVKNKTHTKNGKKAKNNPGGLDYQPNEFSAGSKV